jgi:hypothetical protein
MTETSLEDVQLGPIDYLVVEYPTGQPTGEAMPHLIDLVDSGTIRVLDVAVLAKSPEGDVVALDITDVPEAAVALRVLDGAQTGLLDDEDIAEVGAIMTPGGLAAILVYENTWAAPFATGLRKAGAQLIANGRIPVNALLAALEEENA